MADMLAKARAFVKANIRSVDELRILLFLYSNTEQEWSPIAVSSRLHLDPAVSKIYLEKLAAKGFLKNSGAVFRYSPPTPEAGEMVQLLAQLDRERPVTLINFIY